VHTRFGIHHGRGTSDTGLPQERRSVENFNIDHVLVNRNASHTHFGVLWLSCPSSCRASPFSSFVFVGITTTDSLPQAATHRHQSNRHCSGFPCRPDALSLPYSREARRRGGMRVIYNILHSWLAVALLITTTVCAGVAFSVPDGGPTIISVDASDASRGIFHIVKHLIPRVPIRETRGEGVFCR